MTKQALLEAIKRLITYRSGLSYDDPQQDIVNKNLSVRELEDIINDNNSVKKVPIKKHVQVDERHNVVQSIMREKIGTMVKINNNKIIIPYDSDKDLERILEILNIEIED